jgi:hypothetical protein
LDGLNLLIGEAPAVVEAIVEGRQGVVVTLARLMEPFPLSRNKQKNTLSDT